MTDLDQSPLERERRRKHMGRWIWILTGVLVVLILVLTPPLVNVNRLRLRIAANMSRSLGRPVHLDNVTLNLLPVPGFTLENLVVSEDPSFGSEPVIRANIVKATVRVSSLWRRQVEFATISFEDPSVNLVRRADGRWNIETILLHAAQEDAAPTAQAKPGSAPRFPYIEATAARVNVKMGLEKLPLALTETDFALWLPSPQQWRVRMEGRAVRTDTGTSDTGELSLEGTLERAARVEEVPIDLTAVWKNAPLGESTRLVMGNDALWRGSIDATASLKGTLGDAVLNSSLRVSNLRRSEFVPVKTLDVNMACTGHLAVTVAVLREPVCTVAPAPVSRMGFGSNDEAAGTVTVSAAKVDLTGLKASGLKLATPGVSLAWAMDVARLWSQRTPPDEVPKGTAVGSLARSDSDGSWQGELKGTIAMRSLDDKGEAVEKAFSVAGAGSGVALAPFNLTFAEKTPLLLSGTVDTQRLTFRISGTGTPHQVTFLSWAMPALADGFDPPINASPAGPMKVDVSCTRTWGQPQTCVAGKVAETPKPRRRRH